MNFKKNKDVKRASYYVWFLGAKESKGLRGDEYVQPVLNYILDNECELEPSKVTLQVSSKGLKIIQILTVPRKSSKLNADQQLQLFTATKPDALPSSSVMKSEQVKHHIPHDSISWVYQEDDVICAILLLYNPITRCPVHIHAYRCDSIQTANNLRQQLQTLVDRPENQKKFREIESRLAAKGLLLPPVPPPPCGPPLSLPNSYHHPTSTFDDVDSLGPRGQHFDHPHHHDPTVLKRSYQNNSPSASKTLNSDGRSTRTDGSDEVNSEESNSSDLGYAINRSSSNRNNNFKMDSKSRDQLIHPFIRSSSKSKSTKFSSSKNNVREDSEPPNLYDSLAAELRAKLGNPKMGPLLLPPRDYDSQKSGESKIEKSKKLLRSTRSNQNKLCSLLTRSESSGKSTSSGLGSDEALCGGSSASGTDKNQQGPPPSYYFESSLTKPQQRPSPPPHQSLYLDCENNSQYNRETNDIISHGSENDASSDEDEHFNNHRLQHHSSMVDCLEVDVEDFEEDVIFTTIMPSSKQQTTVTTTKQNRLSSRPRSKSTFDLIHHSKLNNDFDVLKTRQLPHQHIQQFYRQKHLFHSTTDEEKKTTNGNHHFSRDRDKYSNDILSPYDISSSCNKKKCFSNPNLEPATSMTHQQRQILSKEVSKNMKHTTNEKSINSSPSVIGRRKQRFNHNGGSNYRNQNEDLSKQMASKSMPTQKFYFADAEFFSSSSNLKDEKHDDNKHRLCHRGRSIGRLNQIVSQLPDYQMDSYGPMSLNFQSYHPTTIIDMNDRSISPPYYLLQHQQSTSASRNFVPSKNAKDIINSSKRFDQQLPLVEQIERRSQSKDSPHRMFDQPYSRHSYIDVHDDRHHESSARFSAMMIKNKR